MSIHPLEEILHPKSIAIVGASDRGRGGGFVTPLLDLGYKGKLFPVNPKYKEIMGMKAYARITDIPDPVDYVISSIPASGALDLMKDCVQKRVKCVHFFTARFSETGRKDAADLEQEILRVARTGGVRIIGPNCMGIYYPEEGIAFNIGMPKRPGSVGLASQSGGAVGDIVGTSALRGIRFSKAISYGNALDLNECDYLEYFTQDPKTTLILMYIEGVRDGQRFVRTLKQATLEKPVIILKGGRGEAGNRATASHTGSMAGSRELWHAVTDQTGVVTALDFEEMVDVALAFYFLPEKTGRNVGVVGGSGGTSVIAADICEEAGLKVIPIPQEIRNQLKEQNNPIWDWVSNPVDFSISMGSRSDSAIMTELMAKHPDFHLIVSFMSGPGPWNIRGSGSQDMNKIIEDSMPDAINKPMVIVSSSRPPGPSSTSNQMAQFQSQFQYLLTKRRIPTYPNIGRAANAINKMIGYYEKRAARKSE